MLLLDRPPEPGRGVGQDVGGLRLLGYNVRRSAGSVELELHWQAPARIGRLRRVIELLDGSDEQLAEVRGSVLDDLFPTDLWPAGQVLVDRVRLPVGGSPAATARVGWTDARGADSTLDLRLTR
jgi:hypothetical protein